MNELKRYNVFVNMAYNNEKSIQLLTKTKFNNDDTEWSNLKLTIWKTKKDGNETFAFKALKDMLKENQMQIEMVKRIDVDCKDTPDYKGQRQASVAKIDNIIFYTDEEYQEKLRYRQSRQETTQTTPAPTKPQSNDVPWETFEEDKLPEKQEVKDTSFFDNVDL